MKGLHLAAGLWTMRKIDVCPYGHNTKELSISPSRSHICHIIVVFLAYRHSTTVQINSIEAIATSAVTMKEIKSSGYCPCGHRYPHENFLGRAEPQLHVNCGRLRASTSTLYKRTRATKLPNKKPARGNRHGSTRDRFDNSPHKHHGCISFADRLRALGRKMEDRASSM
jgi:hypothetical protein